MKKFFAGLIILLILGGAGFFLGWAQLTVPSGSYGVLRSKTHGLDERLIREGEFRWVWYKLIPTNVTIQVFTPDRIEKTLTFRGSLPSGDVYAAFSSLNADFSYEVSANVSFNIRADALISLVSEKNLAGQDDLAAFEEGLAADVEAFIRSQLEILGENEGEIQSILGSGRSPALEDAIKRAFPQIENLSCRIPAAIFPDFALYRQSRSIYEDFLAKQREYLSAGIGAEAGKQFDSRFRFDELARYGELLTKYPILLQYLALEDGAAGRTGTADSRGNP
ncbi:hypothetical protein AGMMS49587_04590 [Spirochaetia bacterium]|nr:hypothetical protein AGMMS49587_04590 [Spirochaetia bacterium]